MDSAFSNTSTTSSTTLISSEEAMQIPLYSYKHESTPNTTLNPIEERKAKKRFQNRRSIEKCRIRKKVREESLRREKDTLRIETRILHDSLNRARNSTALEDALNYLKRTY